MFDIVSLPYKNFDPFKQYGVTEFLGSLGLSVDRKYRGRGVGAQLLEARCVKYYSEMTILYWFSVESLRKS